MILPAGIGRATVILDKVEYDEKVRQMLSDEKTYEKLKRAKRTQKDPTPIYQKKLVAILSKLKDQGKLSSELYSHLCPTSEKIPKLYCLPKNSQAWRTFQTHSRLHRLNWL